MAPPGNPGGVVVYNRSMPSLRRPGQQSKRVISKASTRATTTRVKSPAPSTSYKGGVRGKVTIGTTTSAVTYTAHKSGTSENTIRIRYVVAGASTPLTVTVSSLDITVNVATSAGSAAISTAQQVADAVNKSKAAGDLVRASVPGTGTGVVSAVGFTNLTGGAS